MPPDPRDADAAEPVAVPNEDAHRGRSPRRGLLYALPFLLVYLGILAWSLVTNTSLFTVLLLAPGVAVFTAAVYLLGRGSGER